MAARGIGQATAELFHEEDATVIVSDILDNAGKAFSQKLGKSAQYIHLDVGN